jgi:hypothetical protein
VATSPPPRFYLPRRWYTIAKKRIKHVWESRSWEKYRSMPLHCGLLLADNHLESWSKHMREQRGSYVVNQTPSSCVPGAGPFLVHRSDLLIKRSSTWETSILLCSSSDKCLKLSFKFASVLSPSIGSSRLPILIWISIPTFGGMMLSVLATFLTLRIPCTHLSNPLNLLQQMRKVIHLSLTDLARISYLETQPTPH